MLYFAYGANLCRAHMRLWCPHSQPLTKAILPGYRLVFRFWADIVPSEGDHVQGALYDVPNSDVAGLEESEDCPELYQRTAVEVNAEGGPVDAVTYQMRPGCPFAPPSEDYLSIIREGYADWTLDLARLPLRA